MFTLCDFRFTTPVGSAAAARSNVAPETFRAIIDTVLFDHMAASSSMNRFDEASDADARSARTGKALADPERSTASEVE